MHKVQIVVTYNDNTIMYYPVNFCWKIDNPSRCIVIDTMPREYIPLDSVRSFSVMTLGRRRNENSSTEKANTERT